MNSDRDDLRVVKNEAEQRYEALVDGRLAVITYQRRADRIIFIHTEVPEALEGHGIAGAMARFALDEARAQGLVVIPRCPFVAAYIRRHPEYADLVPPDERARLLTRQP
jgi:predicted GNAT family acetyltransferase